MPFRSVESDNALDAWRQGSSLVLTDGPITNLLTAINYPCIINEDWLAERSPHRFREGADNVRDVANTIFPARLAARAASRSDLYSRYLRLHDRAHRWPRGRHAWGTYFERLVRFPPVGINQLDRAIEKLGSWPKRNTTGLVFHLSSPAIDAPRTRGGPCWHFGELLWNADGTIDLVAVYRNHDFFNKVLGNFIGLGRLLGFICNEANKQPGRLICHSVHAFHDGGATSLRAAIA